jgi:hypothetical protein
LLILTWTFVLAEDRKWGHTVNAEIVNTYFIQIFRHEKNKLFMWIYFTKKYIKVEKILKGSLDSIPSPSPSVKIQIIRGKLA